jgi:plasmid stabilization system protein ParE
VAEIRFHPAAKGEIVDALNWYLDRSHQAAERFLTALDDAIEAVGSHPVMFPLCDSVYRHVTLKRFPYSIIYRVDETEVFVVAFAHSKRRSRYWSQRK